MFERDKHYCIVVITNRSSQKRFIERPLFIADKLFNEKGTMFGHEGDVIFPVAIESGEKIEFKVPYSIIKEYKSKYDIKKLKRF